MAIVSKILGKNNPGAGIDTTLYTVPVSGQAQANLFICNQGVTTTVRVATVLNGGTLTVSDYMMYDLSIKANAILNVTGMCLNAGDFVVVRSASGSVSFNLQGLEIT